MSSELYIASARDKRAAEILEQSGGESADDLIAAYEQVDTEQAAAYRTAVLGRVRTILGAKYGQTGEPPRAEVLAAWKQAEAELQPADVVPPAAKHASPELEGQNRRHAVAIVMLAEQGKELDHTAEEYHAAYARADEWLAKAGV